MQQRERKKEREKERKRERKRERKKERERKEINRMTREREGEIEIFCCSFSPTRNLPTHYDITNVQ